jgi:hypothetical protein
MALRRTVAAVNNEVQVELLNESNCLPKRDMYIERLCKEDVDFLLHLAFVIGVRRKRVIHGLLEGRC